MVFPVPPPLVLAPLFEDRRTDLAVGIRVGAAMMEAAAMESDLSSPFTIATALQGSWGRRFPSTSAMSMATPSISTARRMASMLA